MDKNIKRPKTPLVYEIEIGHRYLIKIEEPMTAAEMQRLRDRFHEWMQSDETFLLVDADIELVKIESEIRNEC